MDQPQFLLNFCYNVTFLPLSQNSPTSPLPTNPKFRSKSPEIARIPISSQADFLFSLHQNFPPSLTPPPFPPPPPRPPPFGHMATTTTISHQSSAKVTVKPLPLPFLSPFFHPFLSENATRRPNQTKHAKEGGGAILESPVRSGGTATKFLISLSWMR